MIRKATSSPLMTKHMEQPTCSFGIRNASEVGGRSLGGSRAGELPPCLQPDELTKAALFSRYLCSTIFLGGSPATQLSLSFSVSPRRMAWHGMAWIGLADGRPRLWQCTRSTDPLEYHPPPTVGASQLHQYRYSCNKCWVHRGNAQQTDQMDQKDRNYCYRIHVSLLK